MEAATSAAESIRSTYVSVPIDQVRPSRHQARKAFDEEGIKTLADSIDKEGLLNPVTVRQVDGGYELIAGERRFRAVKLLGKPTIEAKVVQPVSEGESAAKGLIENLQREDLNPIEEADGFQELLDLKDAHWNQDQIAKVTGKSKGYISQSLSFLELPPSVREKFSRLNFSRSHALELLRLSNPAQQEEIAQKIVNQDLTREQTRKLVDGMVRKTSKGDMENGRAGETAVSPPPPLSGSPTQPSARAEPDRLQAFWDSLQAKDLGLPIQWQVQYKGSYAWDYHVYVANLNSYREASGDNVTKALRLCLADWFDKMAKACRE